MCLCACVFSHQHHEKSFLSTVPELKWIEFRWLCSSSNKWKISSCVQHLKNMWNDLYFEHITYFKLNFLPQQNIFHQHIQRTNNLSENNLPKWLHSILTLVNTILINDIGIILMCRKYVVRQTVSIFIPPGMSSWRKVCVYFVPCIIIIGFWHFEICRFFSFNSDVQLF